MHPILHPRFLMARGQGVVDLVQQLIHLGTGARSQPLPPTLYEAFQFSALIPGAGHLVAEKGTPTLGARGDHRALKHGG